jgi:hypothetical protein
MTRTALFVLAVIFSAQGWAQLLSPGVYCTTASGPLRLAELPIPGVRTMSWGQWAADDTRPTVHYTWEGASAPALVSDRRPALRVNLGYLPDRSLRSLQIVKLDQKTSHRNTELRVHGELPTEFKGAVPIAVSRGLDGELIVRPDTDLSPGEYMLSLGPLVSQYDFSVR